MYKVLVLALALAIPASGSLELLFTTTNAAGATIGTTTLLSSTAATGLFAAVGIVKVIGLGLLLADAARSKRSIEVGPKTLGIESSFSIVSQVEPAQCIRRLICDVASGQLPAEEADEVILAPFQASVADADVSSQSFDYLVAAQNGRTFGSLEKCELRYSCPLSAQQLRDIFREV